jgi:ubiquinone/menaquinone biosynthesis C-methylase UbiE
MNAAQVQAFFAQWEVYRQCIKHNTLHHREVWAMLHAGLEKQPPFRFLDIACGDAVMTTAALAGTAVTSYTGVDFCGPALEEARRITQELPCPAEFREMDYVQFVERAEECFDVIYLGLSLHHLGRAHKRRTLADIRRRTAPEGCFYLYEPVLLEGESREDCLGRWQERLETTYRAFTPESREAIWMHVSTADHPEETSEYLAAAEAAGFMDGTVLFTDPARLYSLFRFRA